MTLAVFTVWNLNGGPVDESVVVRIEKSIERILGDAEKSDSTRHLTQTTRVESDAS